MQKVYKTIGEWQEALDEQTAHVKYSRWIALQDSYNKYKMKARDIYGFIGTSVS